MKKSTIGVLISLLSVACGDPSDGNHDDAPKSEAQKITNGFYSVQFAVTANPASLGSASVTIFNALGETCAGTTCTAYPLNQAYFLATPKGSAKFVGWSGCSFAQLGHYAEAMFLENVGVIDETCTANFSTGSGTTPGPNVPSGLPSGGDMPPEKTPPKTNPETPPKTNPETPPKTNPETPPKTNPEKTTPEDTTPGIPTRTPDTNKAEPAPDQDQNREEQD